MNYYEELQVSPNASPEVIHETWRVLMRRYHPDNRTTGDSERARRINEAHDVLMDPVKRAAFDQSRGTNESRTSEPKAQPWGHVDPSAYPDAYGAPSIENLLANAAVDIGSAFIRNAMANASPTLRKIFEDALLKRGLPR